MFTLKVLTNTNPLLVKSENCLCPVFMHVWSWPYLLTVCNKTWMNRIFMLAHNYNERCQERYSYPKWQRHKPGSDNVPWEHEADECFGYKTTFSPPEHLRSGQMWGCWLWPSGHWTGRFPAAPPQWGSAGSPVAEWNSDVL